MDEKYETLESQLNQNALKIIVLCYFDTKYLVFNYTDLTLNINELFECKLKLDDILDHEIPFIDSLIDAKQRLLEEKRKAEEKMHKD